MIFSQESSQALSSFPESCAEAEPGACARSCRCRTQTIMSLKVNLGRGPPQPRRFPILPQGRKAGPAKCSPTSSFVKLNGSGLKWFKSRFHLRESKTSPDSPPNLLLSCLSQWQIDSIQSHPVDVPKGHFLSQFLLFQLPPLPVLPLPPDKAISKGASVGVVSEEISCLKII